MACITGAFTASITEEKQSAGLTLDLGSVEPMVMLPCGDRKDVYKRQLSYCICALSVFIICIPLYISVGNRIKGPPVIYFIIERPFEKRFYTVQLKKVYFVFT